jgi:hypothetical protein
LKSIALVIAAPPLQLMVQTDCCRIVDLGAVP